ncbi:MAG: F-box protein, partial [Terriglobus roseus]|nr:F-box protein [Terriglobus roseus]
MPAPALKLGDLPAEIIDHVLSFVTPLDLLRVSLTSHQLHAHAQGDALWAPHVNAQLAHPLASPAPSPSFRALYAAHHPYWFLTRHRVWFADTPHTGKLLLARYSAQRGCIEAYSLNAERGHGYRTFQFWEHDREVIIHTFHPTVALDLNQPALRLDAAAY